MWLAILQTYLLFLDYAEKLNEVDTKNVETTSQVTGLSNVKRPDEVKQKEITKEILDNTPLSKDDFIRLKTFFNMNLNEKTIHELHDLLKSKKISALDITKDVIKRMEEIEGLNVFITEQKSSLKKSRIYRQ